MSKENKEKILRVQNLVIHAKNIEIIQERDKKHEKDHKEHEQLEELENRNPRRNIWNSFWGNPRISEPAEKKENE